MMYKYGFSLKLYDKLELYSCIFHTFPSIAVGHDLLDRVFGKFNPP